jgi:hypothetical protein
VATAVSHVAALRDIDTVLVAVAADQFDARGNFGSRFGQYAKALGLEWPEVRDISCDNTSSPVPARQLIVVLSAMCHLPRTDTTAMVLVHNRYGWPDPRVRVDSVSVTFLRHYPN